MNETVALVVGAGEGHRFGGKVPKQYCPLSGVAVMRRSLLAFLEHPDVTMVRAVIHPGHGDLYHQAAQGLDLLIQSVHPGNQSGIGVHVRVRCEQALNLTKHYQ